MLVKGEYREVVWAKDFNCSAFYLFMYNKKTGIKQIGNKIFANLTDFEKENIFCALPYTDNQHAERDWVNCYYKPWVYGYASNVPISEDGFVCVNHNYTQCLPLNFLHIAERKTRKDE